MGNWPKQVATAGHPPRKALSPEITSKTEVLQTHSAIKSKPESGGRVVKVLKKNSEVFK